MLYQAACTVRYQVKAVEIRESRSKTFLSTPDSSGWVENRDFRRVGLITFYFAHIYHLTQLLGRPLSV